MKDFYKRNGKTILTVLLAIFNVVAGTGTWV